MKLTRKAPRPEKIAECRKEFAELRKCSRQYLLDETNRLHRVNGCDSRTPKADLVMMVMAAKFMECLGGLQIPREEAALLDEWLRDERGKWFWTAVAQDRDDAHAKARVPIGRTFDAGLGSKRYIPADIQVLQSQQNLAAETACDNVLRIQSLVRSWVEQEIRAEKT